MGKFIHRDAEMTVDTGDTGLLDEDLDAAVVDVTDLEKISIFLNQITDAGNVTLTIEKSIDGTNYALVGTVDQDDFPAGANKSYELTLSDSNGMPLSAKYIKASVSGHTSTGSYTMTACGTQREGYR